MTLLFDKINLKTSKRTITDEGYLVIPARIARAGFYSYTAFELGLEDRNPEEILTIYRPPEEVFNEESMKSFARKPVTNDHPFELVDINNIKQYQKGFAGDTVSKDSEGFLTAELTINDKAMIDCINAGKSEVSNGYTADIDMIQGIAEGRRYDGIQRNIKGNHIAIVDKGRAGRNCKLADNLNNTGNVMTVKFLIDGVPFEASEQVKIAVTKLQDSNATLKKEVGEKQIAIADAEKAHKKELDTMQAKLDDAQGKIVSDADLDARVTARVAVIDSAKKIMKDIDVASKSNLEIMKAVVSSKKVDISDKSDDYITARFDAFVDSADYMRDGSEDIKIKEKDAKVKDEDDEEEEMKKKQMSDSENAWKKNIKGDA